MLVRFTREHNLSPYRQYATGEIADVDAGLAQVLSGIGAATVLGAARANAGVGVAFGADYSIDVTQGDAARKIQLELDAIKLVNRRSTRIKIFHNGAVTLTSGIVTDPWYHDVDFCGALVTYTPTSGTAITVQGTTVNAFSQGVGGIRNINLVGPNGVSDTARGLYYAGTVAETRTTSSNENISVYGFNTALELKDYAFITHFRNLTLTNWRSFGFVQSSGSDAGENVTITQGVIANGFGTGIYTQGTSELYAYGLSVDYNARAIETSGKVEMHGGHIEFNGQNNPGPTPALADQIVCTANGSSFRMFGGYLLVNNRNGNGPYGYAYLFRGDVDDCYIGFHGTRLVNAANTADLLYSGIGRFDGEFEFYDNTVAPYRLSSNNNQLIDGGGEQTTVMDLFYVAGTGGAVTSRTTDNSGMAITTATDRIGTGARSIKATRGAVGAGFASTVGLAVPVTHARGKRWWMYLRARATWLDGSNNPVSGVWSLSYCALRNLDTNLIPVWDRRQAYATNFYTTPITDASWQVIKIQNGVAQIPFWATHVLLEIDPRPASQGAPTALWVDDVHFETQ